MNDLEIYDHTADGALGYITLAPALGTCQQVTVGRIPAGKVVKVYVQVGGTWVPYPSPTASTISDPAGSMVLRGPHRYMVDFRGIPFTEDIALATKTLDITVGDTPFGQESHAFEHGVFSTVSPTESGITQKCCSAALTGLVDDKHGNPVFVTHEDGVAVYHTLDTAGVMTVVPEADLRAKPTKSELRFYTEQENATLTISKVVALAIGSTVLPAGARLDGVDMWVLPIGHASDAGIPSVLNYVAYDGSADMTFHYVDEKLTMVRSAGDLAALDPLIANRAIKIPDNVVVRFTVIIGVDIPAP